MTSAAQDGQECGMQGAGPVVTGSPIGGRRDRFLSLVSVTRRFHIRGYPNRCMRHVLSERQGTITVSQHVLPFMPLEELGHNAKTSGQESSPKYLNRTS